MRKVPAYTLGDLSEGVSRLINLHEVALDKPVVVDTGVALRPVEAMEVRFVDGRFKVVLTVGP